MQETPNLLLNTFLFVFLALVLLEFWMLEFLLNNVLGCFRYFRTNHTVDH